MTARDRRPQRRGIGAAMKSTWFRAFMTLGIVLGLSSAHTMAAWTDPATLTTGAIQTGKIDILLNGSQGPVTLSGLGMTDMVPGESVAYGITVNRASDSIPFTYGVTTTASASNTFTQGLRVKIFEGTHAAQSTTNGVRTQACTGSQIGGGASGTQATSGGSVLADRATLKSTTTTSDNVCIQISLAADTASDAQGQSGTVTLTFTAKS